MQDGTTGRAPTALGSQQRTEILPPRRCARCVLIKGLTPQHEETCSRGVGLPVRMSCFDLPVSKQRAFRDLSSSRRRSSLARPLQRESRERRTHASRKVRLLAGIRPLIRAQRARRCSASSFRTLPWPQCSSHAPNKFHPAESPSHPYAQHSQLMNSLGLNVAFSPDGKTIVSGSHDQAIEVGDAGDDPSDFPAAPAGLAPGELADLHDQFWKTSDYFIAVLQQIVENGSDSLERLCDAIKSWCAIDKGRRDACRDPTNSKEWIQLTEKVFTRYGLPLAGEEEPPSPYRNFIGLCNMDPVKRLVRIGRSYLALQKKDVTEGKDELAFQALTPLLRESGHGHSFESEDEDEDPDPQFMWTTKRDDKADVALALINLAEEFGHGQSEFVEHGIVKATLRQLTRLKGAGFREGEVRMLEQLARLVLWIFAKRPGDFLEPLKPLANSLRYYLYRLLDMTIDVIRTKCEGILRYAPDDVVWRAEWAWTALKNIAACKYPPPGGYGYNWSIHAMPSAATCDPTYLDSLLWFLQNGNYCLKGLVCGVIGDVLYRPYCVLPDPRKVAFLKALVEKNAIDHIAIAGIGNLEASRWGVFALSSIARELARLPGTAAAGGADRLFGSGVPQLQHSQS